jgi:pimeloyl-ACP methyl ester carboxylesterase
MDGKYFKSFDGAKIYYHASIKSRDKCLVFIHGLGGDLTAWSKERRYFDDLGISTIALDMRGHGLSDKGDNKAFYSLDNFAKDVAALIDEEKIKNPTVVGHCFGGMVSIYLAAKFPKSSKALVLVDTSYKLPFFSEHLVAKFLIDHLLEILAKYFPDIKAKGHTDYNYYTQSGEYDPGRILQDILHTSLHTWLLILDELTDYDARELLRLILVPSLVIDGTRDTIFPPEIAQYLKNRIKRSEIELIPGANHILVVNDPKDLDQTIESFLKKIKYL